MTLAQQAKLATHLQRLLKVRSVSFPVANTEKGPLYFKHIKDQEGYEIVLDAVPLSTNDYDNRELKSLLEKYLFESEEQKLYPVLPVDFSGIDMARLAEKIENGTTTVNVSKIVDKEGNDRTEEFLNKPKKRGRPAGAKNKNNGDTKTEETL